MSLCKIKKEKIRVVPLAADSRFMPMKNKQLLRKLLQKLRIVDEYLLFVGTLEPRKNLRNVIKAFSIVKNQGFKEKLLIVGPKGWQYKNMIAMIKKLKLENEVYVSGFVEI